MSTLEIITVLFNVLCVVLTIRKNIWCWPTGIVAVILSFVLYYDAKLYADMGLQIVFLGQCAYGWHYWLNGNKTEEKEVPIRQLQLQQWLITLVIVVILWLGMAISLDTWTDADLPYWDAMGTTLSLTAQMLLARKILENWLFWIVVDILYTGILYYKELYLLSANYFFFLILAIIGFLQWKKDALAQNLQP
ncbi:MAG: nicotinamide mononucleotide transporter [Aureispira sp.]|nr:nicotinamide mononucleotide transporter [Aureispira sp.]